MVLLIPAIVRREHSNAGKDNRHVEDPDGSAERVGHSRRDRDDRSEHEARCQCAQHLSGEYIEHQRHHEREGSPCSAEESPPEGQPADPIGFVPAKRTIERESEAAESGPRWG
jgi:hypothetical protein